MNRKQFFNTTKHGDISGDMVYCKINKASPGAWLHKNVFIEVCNRRGKSILPELMAKLLENVRSQRNEQAE